MSSALPPRPPGETGGWRLNRWLLGAVEDGCDLCACEADVPAKARASDVTVRDPVAKPAGGNPQHASDFVEGQQAQLTVDVAQARLDR
jgi:hypothetical protein